MTSPFTKEYAAEQLRRSRHPLRRLIKGFYIRNILKEVIGPGIDFGCGAGQLLALLPQGSIGVEVNPFLVDQLAESGLEVCLYNPGADQYLLSDFPVNQYHTCVISHVLEHLTEAVQTIKTLFHACHRLGIKRIILVLPGLKGYHSDPTHKTFIDSQYLHAHGLLCCEGYKLLKLSYFPVNLESVGKYFVFHEMMVVLDRKV
jgi:2-polyprenyl-3-methyl-5-hydroxy-6-metoxy-1,4-benzoquinol methylase